ncbi:MAG TPA: A/G-specific adenine glycosylase [Chitinophagaceae bacterium]|nr:A/G-specific adenine glycosylase [Chitinophagaceae bacterium]
MPQHPPQKERENKFVTGLLNWNKIKNNREMPWKGEKDPYKIWLSEIILQQTRVEQGWTYYNNFVQTYPTINDLAKAPEGEVFKLWEGLGYYTRCRNLIATAAYISKELKGVFPNEYSSILALKGVGPYTAAAIGSFAFNLPYAVVDGNVFRVLARVFDIELPIDTTGGKNYFSSLAQRLLPINEAGIYNQAIMDFGATICKPQPECAHCFFNKDCLAYLKNKQLTLPVKGKKTAVKERWFHYVIVKCNNEYAIRQRSDKDIWQNLYEFLLVEGDKKLTEEKLLTQVEKSYGIEASAINEFYFLKEIKQRLSHQVIYFSFYLLELAAAPSMESFIWTKKDDLKSFAFPKTLAQIVVKELY